jgi:transcription factor S
MQFCPKCKAILMPKRDGIKKLVVCSCGYKSSDFGDVNVSEQVKNKGKDVEVVDRDNEVDPITKAECPKCHNDEAYFWEIQTRAADEPPTKFMKCTKCKHIWRDYS